MMLFHTMKIRVSSVLPIRRQRIRFHRYSAIHFIHCVFVQRLLFLKAGALSIELRDHRSKNVPQKYVVFPCLQPLTRVESSKGGLPSSGSNLPRAMSEKLTTSKLKPGGKPYWPVNFSSRTLPPSRQTNNLPRHARATRLHP